MTRACTRPGCDGEIEDDGFCDTCGRAPEAVGAPASAPATGPATAAGGPPTAGGPATAAGGPAT
ncbi:MAG TPA: hypothetical protein VGH76_25045, partial [Actinomycetospora sp.]|uniref:hypothetical protein n=1 Tax=Actinomycetospora sp. TaxID=1872135 RepID=UPI002F3E9074